MTNDLERLLERWVALETEFHDNLPSQGECGDPAYGKALCQFLYDNSETLRDTLSLMRRERDDAYAAMRWVYENGMVPHPTRPQWVSDAFNEAFAPIRAANSRSVTKAV